MIITIARERGSGGHEIGQKLAEKLGLEFFDKKKLVEEARKYSDYDEYKFFFEEQPVSGFLRSIAMSEGTSTVQTKAFGLVRQITGGKDFVLIGRCGNVIFRDTPGTTTVFVQADDDFRRLRVMAEEGISEKEAKKEIDDADKKRESFHTYCTEEPWADGRVYDLAFNAGKVGIDKAVEVIEEYIGHKNEQY